MENNRQELLSWELMAAKEYYEFSNQEGDPQRQQLYKKRAEIHKQNYNNLLQDALPMNHENGNFT